MVPTAPTRNCCASFRNWKYYRVFCFCFAGILVLAAILSSVLLTVGSKKKYEAISVAQDGSFGVNTNGVPPLPGQTGGPMTTDEGAEPYPGGDEFANLTLNEMKRVCEEPVSTFSADVDTASYSYCRRMINKGDLPETNAVRAEEMINYFDYDYPLPTSKDKPFEPVVSVSDSPWNTDRKLLHIGIKGYDIVPTERRPSNLVFLLDVSGSMSGEDRLPLVKKSMELLLTELDPQLDIVSIVTYSGEVKVVLEPTPVHQKDEILTAVLELDAGGSTFGAGGLALAYELAEQNFNEDGVNRIFLCSDGDFNVGMTNNDQLQAFVEEKRDKGIFLSVLGFGLGNYKDNRMKALANHGNGVAAYIDNINEARKVLVTEVQATLFPIAKDVKFQVAFNPAMVSDYRLIGYEKRLLQQEDFDNDTVDAGEIGSGHTVTVIYELNPVVGQNSGNVDELCNNTKGRLIEQDEPFPEFEGEYALLKIRYKLPEEDESKLLTRSIAKGYSRQVDSNDTGVTATQSLRGSFIGDQKPMALSSVYRDFDFGTAVAGFAQLLQGGEFIGSHYSYNDIVALAESSKGEDEYGYRAEFIQLVLRFQGLKAEDL